MALWTVRAAWDGEASVWFTLDSDIPGLVADAATVEELAAKAAAMLPDLLEIHADSFVDVAVLDGPHSVQVNAFHEVSLPVAA